MRRVMAPNVKGEYKVSAEIIKQWQNKRGRKSLQQLFQSCGFSPDRGEKNVLQTFWSVHEGVPKVWIPFP